MSGDQQMRKPRLEGIDFGSAEWMATREFIQKRLAELYPMCARSGIDPRTADEIRGAIKELEQFLELSEAKPLIPSDIYS